MKTVPIEDSFTGTLLLWGIHCNYSFSKGHLLEIRPFQDETDAFICKCKESKGIYDGLGWIYGNHRAEYDVAFFASPEQGPICFYRGTLTLIVDIVLETSNFKNADGSYPYGYKDLHGFTAIDFAGKPVDAIFPPKEAIIRNEPEKRQIGWLPYSEYAKEYTTEIEGISCKLILTTVVDRCDLDLESNSLGTVQSILRIEFSERQNNSMIIPCWQAVCSFLEFCIGQHNATNLDIALWDEERTIGAIDFFGLISCIINDEKEDDIRSIYPSYYRFQIRSLGEKTGDLFRILSDGSRRPILGFLPKSNTDISINRNKIRDLCTAFEVEFDYRKSDLSEPGIESLVQKLIEVVKQFKSENHAAIDKDEYSYINSSVNAISKPARKKILSIYNRYSVIINKHILDLGFSSTTNYVDTSDETTAKDIGWIVKTRNTITHSAGSIEEIIPNMIYSRLRVAIFCSVLERAGYTVKEIEKIIEDYFRGMVPHFRSKKEVSDNAD